MAKYTIREANIDDADNIANLRRRIKEYESFETDTYSIFWEHLIWNNPCHIHKSIVAVDKQGEIIGHYAIIPYKFRLEGKSLIGGFVCQLMVDENFRNELVFPKMMQKMLRDFKEIGIDFLYSLSSKTEVVKAHQAFGFKKLGDIPVYGRPFKLTKIIPGLIQSKILNTITYPVLAIADICRRVSHSSHSNNFNIKEISSFNNSFDDFLEKINKYFPLSILRNSDILNWRTSNVSARNYRIIYSEHKGVINGYVIVRNMTIKTLNTLAIVDIMFSPDSPAVGKALLNAVHGIAIQTNADLTTFLLNIHAPLFPLVKKYGYFKTPEYIALFVYEPRGVKPRFTKEIFEKWHLSWIDHDSI